MQVLEWARLLTCQRAGARPGATLHAGARRQPERLYPSARYATLRHASPRGGLWGGSRPRRCSVEPPRVLAVSRPPTPCARRLPRHARRMCGVSPHGARSVPRALFCASPRLPAPFGCVRASACIPVRGFVVLFCEVCLEPLRDGGPACGGGGGRSGQESANGGTDGGLRKGVREERGKRSRGSERAPPVARARGRPPATGCRCAALPLRAARRARARCLCSTHLHASGRELSGGNGARRVEGSLLLPSISEASNIPFWVLPRW